MFNQMQFFRKIKFGSIPVCIENCQNIVTSGRKWWWRNPKFVRFPMEGLYGVVRPLFKAICFVCWHLCYWIPFSEEHLFFFFFFLLFFSFFSRLPAGISPQSKWIWQYSGTRIPARKKQTGTWGHNYPKFVPLMCLLLSTTHPEKVFVWT